MLRSRFNRSAHRLMKILYITQYFPPEMGAPAARTAELAQHWGEAGHDVSILTGFPNHPTGVVPLEWRSRFHRLAYREKTGRVQVFRTWLWPLPNRKAHERMRNYASFCLSAALRGLGVPRPDVIIATSPQILVGLSGWWLGFTKRVPFVFEVRDLWPESLIAVGAGDGHSLLHKSLSGLADFLYQRSEHIVVVSPAFKEHLMKYRDVPSGKISIVQNGVETSLFAPSTADANHRLRQRIGAEGKFLVCYVGTMGWAHGLDTLLDAATQLQTQSPNVLFVLIGEGADKERIKSISQSRRLNNLSFFEQQPRDSIPGFISASDACLVLLKKADVFKTVIPTKMLEFMSCARPVILGVDGQARQMVEDAGAGIVIEPESSVALAQAIGQLVANPELGHALGQRGREYILRNHSRRQTADCYLRVLEELLASPQARKAEAAA
jgi:colanic acid biosynthesis glycosyl transferase WcaI